MQTTLVSILDNGGKTVDRYTLSFITEDGESFMYAASENPFHPQGFGQFAGDGGFPDSDEFPEIGWPIELHELPEQVQKLIKQIEEE